VSLLTKLARVPTVTDNSSGMTVNGVMVMVFGCVVTGEGELGVAGDPFDPHVEHTAVTSISAKHRRAIGLTSIEIRFPRSK
jgi:hypothetical protein